MGQIRLYIAISGGIIYHVWIFRKWAIEKWNKKILIDCNVTNKEVAERMGITPQTYQHLINKKQLSFSDVKRIADNAGFKVMINFVPTGKYAE